jgi:hypothetical protein
MQTIMKPTFLIPLMLFFGATSCINEKSSTPIDRFSLVNRHNIQVETIDPLASLSAGNGNFAFTTDITGLQTFYREYENGVSTGTQSNWGWHTVPNDSGFTMEETYVYYSVKDRSIPYQHQTNTTKRAAGAVNYFRENPHRLHLGLIRLVITKDDGQEITPADIQNPRHRLDIWRGRISSHFQVEGIPVEVLVYVHQELDLVSAKIISPLIREGRLTVEWLFPYGLPVHTHAGYDLNSPEKHTSEMVEIKESGATIHRALDNGQYFAQITWPGKADLKETNRHTFMLAPAQVNDTLEFSTLFSAQRFTGRQPDFRDTENNNAERWAEFWMNGGAVDFSACTDPRAFELERRVVLSQYLTKINGSGNLPPQETGLTFNSWFGKFHLEMHWWHSAHFANWGRTQYLEKQMPWYRQILDQAETLARIQGYSGVRWPKMVGPEGINSPSAIGSYLIWQQPHLIYFAEQLYRANPSSVILDEYADLVFATADFMADFPLYNPETGHYDLAPPLIPAQEHWPLETTFNPPFELAYWHWGLSTALDWKERMGEPQVKKWKEVRDNLPHPESLNGIYLGIANAPDSYTNPLNMRDHPMVLGTLGMLPRWEKVDPEIMRNTLKLIMKAWDWHHTWGWDYPMVAMCATRLLEPEIAIEALMKDVQKNTYLINGHNYQDDRLRIYLPGNGGLLKTIALMCAGWEGNQTPNPGFPKDGKWNVRWENLSPDF